MNPISAFGVALMLAGGWALFQHDINVAIGGAVYGIGMFLWGLSAGHASRVR